GGARQDVRRGGPVPDRRGRSPRSGVHRGGGEVEWKRSNVGRNGTGLTVEKIRRRFRYLCTTRCVALGVGARGAYTRGHSETRHGDVCLPEPAPRLRVPPSWRPRV